MTNTFLYQNSKDFFRLKGDQIFALKKLGITTLQDILYHFPSRYESSSSAKLIQDLIVGETITIYGKVSSLKTGKSFRSHVSKAEGWLDDDTGRIKLMWFHQPYIAKLIQNDSLVKVHGKISEKNGHLSMLNPEIAPVSAVPNGIGDDLFMGTENMEANLAQIPVYAESKGITSKWFFHAIQKIFRHPEFAHIKDPIPSDILKKYNLPSLATALVWIHTPKKDADAKVAEKRFAFEEIFYIQLKNEFIRAEQSAEQSFVIEKSADELASFTSRFPFALTDGQQQAIDTVLADFKTGHPMSRLLEGDVGSGKTAVAAVTTYATVASRPKGQDFGTLQVAYMAPTEILARQHFESFIQYFKHMPISIGLITGNGCRKFPSKINKDGWTDISRTQFLKWVASGEISVVIGTHALIQKSVDFKHLAYVIIDEQHRFGTAQRQKLTKKNVKGAGADITAGMDRDKPAKVSKFKTTPKTFGVPHLLSMTATPIPRTLALTMYGDLDLSILDQMPSGRKKIITEIVGNGGKAGKKSDRETVYEHIREELNNGRQAYVICPRINEPDPEKEQSVLARSVKEEAKRLKSDVFKEFRIDIMHSKMKPAEKEEVMERFSRHEIDILVSTSVVEVGVNVPNASLIIIEGGERFGLSQLHQLRGRVIRGNHQPYCYVFTSDTRGNGANGAKAGSTSGGKSKSSDKTIERLKALATAKNGFELAELDLAQRGAGELYAGKQWGLSDIAMNAIKNLKMVEAARSEAQLMVKRYEKIVALDQAEPLIAEILKQKRDVHFE
ncbi:MAG: ATP-dependent DNA helicase RecG [Candidatus Pacebacteria bacterium]|nr:ATP-dependent DNA helicase RecG [Candidatus Paceibacterota bacterium]